MAAPEPALLPSLLQLMLQYCSAVLWAGRDKSESAQLLPNNAAETLWLLKKECTVTPVKPSSLLTA